MGSNSREVSHFICTVPEDRKEYTLEIRRIVNRFFGEDAKIIQTKCPSGAQKFEVQLPVQDDPEALELRVKKLHNLCRIKVHALGWKLGPSPKSGLPVKDRPDTIRIENIPKAYTIEQVQDIVEKDFGSKPRIHSLALSTEDYLCATVTFPDEECGFPLEKLQKLKHLSHPDAPKIAYDADFLHFTTLYNASPKSSEVHVDIVAVVGLGTHAFGTFRSMVPGSYKMWLRDFLPKDIPESRILLYGYPSPVSGAKSVEIIEDIARVFLDRLAFLRKNTSTLDRPIIFIGQSLGGLIVQQALLQAGNSCDQNELGILRYWHGLVGFGIPIAGLDNPSLMKTVKAQPNKDLIRQICLDEDGTPSHYLRNLKKQFEECCKEKGRYTYAPELTYFWETFYSRPRHGNGIDLQDRVMVPSMGIQGAKSLVVHADHSGMVKYDEESNVIYKDVKNKIRVMVDNLGERERDVSKAGTSEASLNISL
ncbi:9c06afb1-543f-4728-b364-646f092bdf2d [Sclerotinia trifoliorum]|uniref:9c06afb1-543f-4728-b364-646f092bdf2d n=1 Tax=Sclerotinia trifoliorum TaxID=28548 RepID=A0A8H2VUX9_9HELO|nr:9c06afb1-543f-4728-b364-646f092bdf2d [Sclerotinia trifoliorum]